MICHASDTEVEQAVDAFVAQPEHTVALWNVPEKLHHLKRALREADVGLISDLAVELERADFCEKYQITSGLRNALQRMVAMNATSPIGEFFCRRFP